MFLMSIRMELMKAAVLVSPIEFMSGALEGSCPTLGDADRYYRQQISLQLVNLVIYCKCTMSLALSRFKVYTIRHHQNNKFLPIP